MHLRGGSIGIRPFRAIPMQAETHYGWEGVRGTLVNARRPRGLPKQAQNAASVGKPVRDASSEMLAASSFASAGAYA